jgi:hypothetical protein
MEYCVRCRERWFAMGLRNETCDACFLRDKGSQSPFLMSAENEMDPGEVPAHLPALTQVEEMIIARSHVQMLVHRYRGHQYHYSGHCVSFMQSNVKTVDALPNLPSELDIVVLRPSNQVMEDDPRYQPQFRADFRVRRGHVLTWLHYLKANHPDYRWIKISTARLNTLPVDNDISSSFPSIVDESIVEEPPVTDPQLRPTCPLRILNRWSLISMLIRRRPTCCLQVFRGGLPFPACQHHRFDRLPSMKPLGGRGSLPWPSQPSIRRAGLILIAPGRGRSI